MKKLLSFVLVALLMLCALSVVASAEEGPVVYISFGGNNANDGLTADTPKKQFGYLDGNGVVSLLANGGTLVPVGKAYIGGTYTLPALGGPLTITSVYGGVDYKNPEPATNPACAFKMYTGVSLTISSDVIFDDVILFQEGVQNTLIVPTGVTVTVTDKAVLMKNEGVDYHWKLQLAEGAKAVLSQAAQEVFTIENNGGTVETYGAAAPVTPETPVTPTVTTEVKMTAGKTEYTVNGAAQTMDVAPAVKGEKAMLPVRHVAQALGATVDWDSATSTATIKTADTEIKIVIGAAEATVNGVAVALDVPAYIENDRTYMSMDFIAGKLGATAAWDAATSTATITK
ncbi:MAG: copper amine oxidase N-terminal domain-containing protein [Clostridia bacterium]|nr:copper amine oxidase N-terminal domain-containing protein [Clostridia bacterium]